MKTCPRCFTLHDDIVEVCYCGVMFPDRRTLWQKFLDAFSGYQIGGSGKCPACGSHNTVKKGEQKVSMRDYTDYSYDCMNCGTSYTKRIPNYNNMPS